MTTYYVYAQGFFNLWALVFTTTNKNSAKHVALCYEKSKVLTQKMN
jgi:hypothetical protein